MKKVMKLSTKETIKAQEEYDEQKTNDMITFWMSYKDHEWNPWFLPTEWWWYSMNLQCKKTAEQFNSAFRDYLSK